MIKKLHGLYRNVDGGLLLALIMGAIAAWPFLAYPSLPRATDAELHIFRVAELGQSLRAGNPYPRWAPDFYHGYGYPIFNYYAPLTYHLGNWVTFLHPEKAVHGAKVLFIGASLLGAVGAYLLGREFGGRGGGLLGAATFVYAPYILLVNPHIRGDLAEVFALSLLPLALWSWERLWKTGGKGAFFSAVISAGAIVLSHNLTGLTTILLLMLLSVWQWLVARNANQFAQALLAGMLVITLTAFFWLPFLFERQFVQLDVAGEGHYDFRNHFVLLRELLTPLRPMDWRAATLHPPMSASPWLLALAIVGVSVAALRKKNRCRLLFYTLSSALCFWLVTPESQFAWENIPGLAYYQFPWRFLGPLAALLVPPVASIGTVHLTNKRYAGLMVLILCLVLATALPALYPIPWSPDFGSVDTVALLNIELQGRWRGTTSTNDFVPTTVEMIPGPQESLLNSYKNPPVDRVNRYMVPENATVTVLPDVSWRNHFVVQTPDRILLRLYLFYFPGWKAYIDGKEVPVGVAHPEGFITVWVPSGEHDVLLCFEDTPPRKAGWVIAGGGLFVFPIAIWRFPRKRSGQQPIPSGENLALKWMAICLGCWILLKGFAFDPLGWFHYTSSPGEVLAAQTHQNADFGDEIALLGFDLSDTHLKPGQAFDVALYWNALRPVTETYQSFVHLVYPEGKIWVQSDHLNPAGFPTNLWPTDRYVRDSHRLVLPPDMPPGEYVLSVGIYTLRNNNRLAVSWADSGARADNVVLSKTITVRP